MVREGSFEEAYEVLLDIPELANYVTFERMAGKREKGALVLVCEQSGVLVGFKIGYALSANKFYSWLGGVIPKYRKTGAAQALLEHQESLVVEGGYKYLSVKSMNQYSAMLRLLIKNNYHIIKVQNYGDKDKERVCFRKLIGNADL